MSLRVASAVVALAAAGCVREPGGEEPVDAGRVVLPRAPDCLALPNVIDFGEVEATSRGDVQFLLTNNTVKPIDLTIGPASPPFFISVEGVLRVESGKTVALRLSFVPPDPRLQLGVLDYTPGAGCTPQHIELRGAGAGQLTGPRFVDLGPVPLGVPISRRIPIANSRRVAVGAQVTAFGPVRPATNLLTVPALGAAELEVSMTPSQPGHLEGTLQLTSERGDRLLINVGAQGGVPRAVLSAAAVRVEQLPMSNDPFTMPLFQRTVILSNQGDGQLDVTNLAVRAEAGTRDAELIATLANNPIGPGGTSELRLHFVPERVLGPRSWVVRLLTTEPGREALELPVSAEVVSLPSCSAITVAPPSIRVPRVSVPAAPEISIKNGGLQDCLLDDLRLSPPTWALSPAREQVLLTPDASYTVSIAVVDAGSATFVVNPVGAGLGYVNVPVTAP